MCCVPYSVRWKTLLTVGLWPNASMTATTTDQLLHIMCSYCKAITPIHGVSLTRVTSNGGACVRCSTSSVFSGKRWIKEYRPELQQRQKWLSVQKNIKVGDLVLMMDELSPRVSWPLALVEEIKMGGDGLARSARVRTQSTQLVRPLTKLVLLEGSHYDT